jgi:hypothetical protein
LSDSPIDIVAQTLRFDDELLQSTGYRDELLARHGHVSFRKQN